MTFRILSIDGGGIRGAVAAKMLEPVEKRIDRPLSEYFQLFAGTSSGSIVAAATALGYPSQSIVELFQQQGQQIFPYTKLWAPQRFELVMRHGLSSPKFSDTGLIEVLQEAFGNRVLPDVAPAKLLIPAYDTIERKPVMFKSWRSRYAQLPIWEACVCSASAPTFFPAHRLELNGKVLSVIDGGLAANNPAACALAAALRLGHPLETVQMLSIGTGDPTEPIPWEAACGFGALNWIQNGRVIKVMNDGPSDVYHYIIEQLIREPSRYLRLQFPLDQKLNGKPLSDAIDDASPGNISNLLEATSIFVNQPQQQEALNQLLSAT